MNKADFDVKIKYLRETKPKFVGFVLGSQSSKRLHLHIYEDDDYELIAKFDEVDIMMNLQAIIDGATLEEICQEYRYIRSKYMKRQMNNMMKEVRE